MPILYSKVTTEPSAEPILIADAKNHLRVDHDDEDLLINILIQSARETVEQRTNRSLITQTRTMKMDYFPLCWGRTYRAQWPAIELPYGPVSSVTSVKYYDESDVEQTYSSSNYWVDISSGIPKIVVKNSWPSTYDKPNAVEVVYVAGYGVSGSSVPSPIRNAMLLLIAHLYEHREQVGEIMHELPFGVHDFIAPYILEQNMKY